MHMCARRCVHAAQCTEQAVQLADTGYKNRAAKKLIAWTPQPLCATHPSAGCVAHRTLAQAVNMCGVYGARLCSIAELSTAKAGARACANGGVVPVQVLAGATPCAAGKVSVARVPASGSGPATHECVDTTHGAGFAPRAIPTASYILITLNS